MELQQIRAFLAVAEELHFGKAAERLGMAQPPLSRSIRQFEKELGAELFHRTTRQVSLAPAGEALIGPARALLEAADTAEQSVRFATTGDIGRVRLGFGGLSSHPLVGTLLRESRIRRPGISFALEANVYTIQAGERLSNGSLDLALMRWESQPPHIAGRPVMVERPVVAVYGDHRLAGRSSVTMKDLEHEHLVLLQRETGSTLRELTLRWCYRAGYAPKIAQEAPDAWMIGTLVSSRLGVAIAYDSIVSNFTNADIVMIPLEVEHDPIVVHLAHKDAPETPALREILAIAETALPTVEVPG